MIPSAPPQGKSKRQIRCFALLRTTRYTNCRQGALVSTVFREVKKSKMRIKPRSPIRVKERVGSGEGKPKGAVLLLVFPPRRIHTLVTQFIQKGSEVLGHEGEFVHGFGGLGHAVAGFHGDVVDFFHGAGDFL